MCDAGDAMLPGTYIEIQNMHLPATQRLSIHPRSNVSKESNVCHKETWLLCCACFVYFKNLYDF